MTGEKRSNSLKGSSKLSVSYQRIPGYRLLHIQKRKGFLPLGSSHKFSSAPDLKQVRLLGWDPLAFNFIISDYMNNNDEHEEGIENKKKEEEEERGGGENKLKS